MGRTASRLCTIQRAGENRTLKWSRSGTSGGNAVFVGCDGQRLTGLDQKQEAYIWQELLRGI